MKKIVFIFLVSQLSACTAEIGSEIWCTDLKEKNKGEWTMNEAKDFLKHFLLK